MQIRTALLILASASVAAAAQSVPATPFDSNTVMSAEQAALRIALDSSFIRAGSVIVINPMMAPTGVANGEGSAIDQTLRPVPRTDRLVKVFKASSKERDKVISCASSTSTGPRCDILGGADAYVSASQPRFDGGLATVTVTIEAQGTRGTLAYETLTVVMANTSNGWKPMRVERVGRS